MLRINKNIEVNQQSQAGNAGVQLAGSIKARIPGAEVLFSMANGQVVFNSSESGSKRTLLARVSGGAISVSAVDGEDSTLRAIKQGIQVGLMTSSASMSAEAKLRQR